MKSTKSQRRGRQKLFASWVWMATAMFFLSGFTALRAQQGTPPAPQGEALPPAPQEESSWELRLDAKYMALTKQNGAGRDPALTKRLMEMRAIDQDVRNRLMLNQNINTLPVEERRKLTEELAATDAAMTMELKAIVAAKGWPTVARVGLDGSKAAALLLTHSPDHLWQKSLLPQLQRLVEANKIAGDDVALIVDKTLKADGKRQRFGTQFDFKEGGMVMWPVEEPARLDALRQEYLLPPMEEYRAVLAQMYHMKVQ